MRLIPVFSVAVAAVIWPAAPLAQSAAPAKPKLESEVFDWSKLPVVKTQAGERRAMVNAPTATFDNFSCHATTIGAGQVAHPPHRHPDEEIVIVKEGTIEVLINERRERAGAGSMFFFASNDLHGMRNVGDTAATYYVIRVITPRTPKTEAK